MRIITGKRQLNQLYFADSFEDGLYNGVYGFLWKLTPIWSSFILSKILYLACYTVADGNSCVIDVWWFGGSSLWQATSAH